jgi:hypothetical protein
LVYSSHTHTDIYIYNNKLDNAYCNLEKQFGQGLQMSQYMSPTIPHKEFHNNSLQNYRCFKNYNFQIIVMINYNWPTSNNTNHNIEIVCKYVLTRVVHKRNHLVSFDYIVYFQTETILITMRIIYNLQKPNTTYLSVK